MMLEAPCEAAVKKYIPSIRASVAVILVKDYKVSVYRTAKLLGLTPAAVGNYLRGVRGNSIPFEEIMKSPAARYVREIAEALVTGDSERLIRESMLCRACSALREYMESKPPECHFKAREAKPLDGEKKH